MVRPVAHTPTRDELLAARGRSIPDVIAPGLKVLFCGINPGLYSGATGHHFARPGNRFWAALFRAGFTDKPLQPAEERLLLDFGCGITNIVNHATARASDLNSEELRTGKVLLERKVGEFHPRFLAVLGIDAYRKAFERPRADMGPQDEGMGETGLWVLPNPSGINAAYQLNDLTRLFSELRIAAGTEQAP